MITPLVLVAAAVLGYALLSRRLAPTVITAPIFFAGVGLLAGPVLGIVDGEPDHEGLVTILEAALVMVLFADSAGLDVRRWTGEVGISERLLGIGLPLTMIAGALLALVLLPGLAIWQVALIGVILAPTDAALGQAVVANPRVPAIVRNALNVESGLNDGLALPFVTIFIAIGRTASGLEGEPAAVQTLVLALGGSTVVGALAGLAGGALARASVRRGLGEERWIPIGLVGLALGTYGLADAIGASGFLAVWVAGLTTGAMVRGRLGEGAFRLPEQAADVLAAIGFLLIGAWSIVPIMGRATPVTLVYALLSLTVVRIVPVAVAMLRTGFATPSLLYIGWFGPRGLASIVFAGVLVETEIPNATAITDVVLLTVAMSLVLHGVTAAAGARAYASWFDRARAANPAIPEAAEVAEPVTGRRRATEG